MPFESKARGSGWAVLASFRSSLPQPADKAVVDGCRQAKDMNTDVCAPPTAGATLTVSPNETPSSQAAVHLTRPYPLFAGNAIDSHEVVMRINQAPTNNKYHRHVGAKTTFRLINTRWANKYGDMRFLEEGCVTIDPSSAVYTLAPPGSAICAPYMTLLAGRTYGMPSQGPAACVGERF